MDSPEIRELEQFANEFKVRRIKLGMPLVTAKGKTTSFANLTFFTGKYFILCVKVQEASHSLCLLSNWEN